MEGTITITLNNNFLTQVSASQNPKLFLDLVSASSLGTIEDAVLVTATKAPRPPQKRPPRSSAGDVPGTTRSSASRERLDQELYNVLKNNDWTRLEGLGSLHDRFTPAQLRESARRLVARGRAERRGQARATEYRATKSGKTQRDSVLRERTTR